MLNIVLSINVPSEFLHHSPGELSFNPAQYKFANIW